jgi:Ca2+-binding RTX toxin-like protein
MRRVTLMVAAVAMMVSLFAVAAYAAEIMGTGDTDYLTESQRADTIKALTGDDQICAGPYQNADQCKAGFDVEDTPTGFGDRDRVHGNRGDDQIDVQDDDGKDIAWAGKGEADECWTDPGDLEYGCESVNGVPQP